MGGVFSPVVPEGNKAGHDGRNYRSYGTATADGILSHLACGSKPDSPGVQSAWTWLKSRHVHDHVPGFVEEARAGWSRALLYYYSAASTEVFTRLNSPKAGGWKQPLEHAQRNDGSWRNPNPS